MSKIQAQFSPRWRLPLALALVPAIILALLLAALNITDVSAQTRPDLTLTKRSKRPPIPSSPAIS